MKDKLSKKEITKIIEEEEYDNNPLLDKKVNNIKSLKNKQKKEKV